jgi:hypothetical protein
MFSSWIRVLDAFRHEVEIKGGLKTPKDKGLKITDYHEDIPRPRKR